MLIVQSPITTEQWMISDLHHEYRSQNPLFKSIASINLREQSSAHNLEITNPHGTAGHTG